MINPPWLKYGIVINLTLNPLIQLDEVVIFDSHCHLILLLCLCDIAAAAIVIIIVIIVIFPFYSLPLVSQKTQQLSCLFLGSAAVFAFSPQGMLLFL